MQGKICLVSGATSGIGKATAMEFAKVGASVVLLCRNEQKGYSVAKEITEATNNQNVKVIASDYRSLRSVREASKQFVSLNRNLHVLVNNAGSFNLTHTLTEDGYETTFQVNYLSHFLLTNLLLDVLKRSTPARIINVTSVGHYHGRITEPYWISRNGSGMSAYANSKLALVLFTYEMARRLNGSGVTCNCLHPGTVATGIWSRPLGIFGFLASAVKPFMKSPEEASKSILYVACSPDMQDVTGKYFDEMKEAQSSTQSYDINLASRLWEASKQMCGIDKS
jgi:NAD(P)-dependent dehydrogenase (short-subunit alcohol dehydrogenase family)